MGGRANPLTDRKVVGVVFFGVGALVSSPTTATCSVVCSVVVSRGCICSVVVVAVVVAWFKLKLGS